MSIIVCLFGPFFLLPPKIESFGDGLYLDFLFPHIQKRTRYLIFYTRRQGISNLIGQLYLFLNILKHLLIKFDESVNHDFC